MKWIAAARVLATAQQLYKRLSVGAHRQVALMDIPHQSQRFRRFFDMSASYYYGTLPLHMPAEQQLDEAAKMSTKGDGNAASTLLSVPERVIHTVWLAVAYPKEYRDVIGEKFSEGDRLFLPTGLQTYLSHRDHWHSAAGQLHQRARGESSD